MRARSKTSLSFQTAIWTGAQLHTPVEFHAYPSKRDLVSSILENEVKAQRLRSLRNPVESRSTFVSVSMIAGGSTTPHI